MKGDVDSTVDGGVDDGAGPTEERRDPVGKGREGCVDVGLAAEKVGVVGEKHQGQFDSSPMDLVVSGEESDGGCVMLEGIKGEEEAVDLGTRGPGILGARGRLPGGWIGRREKIQRTGEFEFQGIDQRRNW